MKIIKNIYFLTGVTFLVWIAFFDNNNLISQYKLKNKQKELQDQKQYYIDEIVRLEEEMIELKSNPKQLEKFAREKYLFQKKGEDVFIIKEKRKKK